MFKYWLKLKRLIYILLYKLKIRKWHITKWIKRPIWIEYNNETVRETWTLNNNLVYWIQKVVNSWLPYLIQWKNKFIWKELWIIIKKDKVFYKIAKIQIAKNDWSIYFFMPYHKARKWFFYKSKINYNEIWNDIIYDKLEIDRNAKVSIHSSWFSQISWKWILSWLEWNKIKWYWFYWTPFEKINKWIYTTLRNINLSISKIEDYDKIDINNLKYDHLIYDDENILKVYYDENKNNFSYMIHIWLLPYNYTNNELLEIYNSDILGEKYIYRLNHKNKISLWFMIEKMYWNNYYNFKSWYNFSFANSNIRIWELWESIKMEYYE